MYPVVFVGSVPSKITTLNADGSGKLAGHVQVTVTYTVAADTSTPPDVVSPPAAVEPEPPEYVLDWLTVTMGGAGYDVPPGVKVYGTHALKSCGELAKALNDWNFR